jgi:hypothetical protein
MQNQNASFGGLGTFICVPPSSAGSFFVKGKITLPTITDDANGMQGTGASSVVVTVNQNGSPVYVGLPGAEGFYAAFGVAANDTITVVLSSSNANDQGLNTVKVSNLSYGSGL